MLLGKGGGLPHLNGAHIKVIFADHQNDPQKARAETERLITQEHAIAIIGSYTSRDRGDDQPGHRALRSAVYRRCRQFQRRALNQPRPEMVLPHQPA